MPEPHVVELRQYELVPGRRDTLIELFEREFVESQEALGIHLVGTFVDLDNPDRFVWMRAFANHAVRNEALPGFYYGPVWKAHRDEANATMVDSDNVLLLRSTSAGPAFPIGPDGPVPVTPAPAPSMYAISVYAVPSAEAEAGRHQPVPIAGSAARHGRGRRDGRAAAHRPRRQRLSRAAGSRRRTRSGLDAPVCRCREPGPAYRAADAVARLAVDGRAGSRRLGGRADPAAPVDAHRPVAPSLIAPAGRAPAPRRRADSALGATGWLGLRAAFALIATADSRPTPVLHEAHLL